jgi:hypothetical protein
MSFPTFPSLGGGLPSLPRLAGSGGARQPTIEEILASMPRSQQLEVAGAPDVDIEKARQQERLLGPTGIRTVAQARGERGDPLLGIEEPEPRRGLLEVLSDYILRPQAAVTGFVTGLTGMERLRQTRDASGVADGTLFERPEQVRGGLGLALERFGQGIRGEEKFQAADFGALAYDRNDAGIGERFIKSATGFVLDVALDPITYVSFGGSILGRRAGAAAVNSQARQNVTRLTNQLSPAERANAVREAVRRGGTDESVLLANLKSRYGDDLARAGIPETGLQTVDDMLSILGQNNAFLQGAANDSIAYTAAAMYRWGGAGATKKYLEKNFGRAGTEMWNALPADLRGGVRFRVPLSGAFNRATGRGAVPTSLRLSPLPSGMISEMTGFAGLSNGAREALRSKALLRPIGDNLSGMTGATDRATASMLYKRNSERAGTWFGRKDPKVDPQLRATSWASSQELEAALGQFRAGVMGSARQLMEPVTEAQKFYRQGRELGAEQFDELFDRAIRANLADEAGDVASMEQLFGVTGRRVNEQEIAAYNAAFEYQKALRTIENQLVELESRTAGFSANLLENYWPRIVDDMERELSGRGIAGFGNLKERTHFVAEFNLDGTVRRWMTPREIAAQLNSPKFVENAEAAMASYLVSMNRFLQEERLFQRLLDQGVLFRGGRDAFKERLNLSAASQRWIETWNSVNARKAALERVGRAEGADPLTGAGVSGRSLDEVVAQATRLGEALQAGRVYGPRMSANYVDQGNGRWLASDGVEIERLANGTFMVSRRIDGEQQWLTEASRWSKSRPDKSSLTFEDARARADRSMATVRKREFVDQMQDLQDEFYTNYTAMLRGYEGLEAKNLNPFDPANVPLDHQNEYFEVMVDAINRFGDAAGLMTRERKARVYRDEKWGAGLGAAFAPVSGENGQQMRRFWSDRMERLGVFAPETVAEDVRRIYRAIDTPTVFRQWVDDYYRPFYALQKSLMTSQRGPGYVLRNIQGGMWNAYLLGTNARHFNTAGGVKVAEYQARARAKREAPDSVKRQAEIAQREFRKILNQRFGEKRGADLYNTWELFEMRGLRGREIASRTPGTQAVATATGELSGDLVRLIPDADATGAQRLAEWGTSHWWARTMGDMAQGSEDYLRFASFLRGADMYGLEDGGRAASLIVKASQFDYSDLSRFEAESVKMLVPFYTWTRNNVPLQFRAMISEPGKIQKAIRLNDALADAFGDPDDPEEPLPGYVRERFGWRVRKDIFTGPSGDAITAGMVVGEPLVDVNRLFGTATRPGSWGLSNLNWREIANNLNPIVPAASQAFTSMEFSTGGRLPREEEAPRWAEMLGLGRVTPEGDRVMNAQLLRATRQLVVPLGMAERYAPQLLGNERLQRRWYTSMASAILGLPVSTLDPFQTTAEMRAQEQRLRGQLERQMGEEYPDRVAYVRAALELGATPEEMQFIRDTMLGGKAVSDVPIEELDVWRMRDTINFLRRIDRLRAQGVPEETLRMMAEYFNPRTDLSQGVRAGGVQPLTAEQLQELGETPESVARMTDAERAELLQRYAARNPDWRPRSR